MAYDYSRRGRSRSPQPDEAGRKRRRSMSPYERDRYEPRPRYNDDYDAHSRGYGYSSPRRGHGSSFPPNRRAPPDPHTFDYPASLKQYAEWFRYYFPQQAIDEDNADKAAEHEAGDGSKPRNGIKSKWEKYKKDFAATQVSTFPPFCSLRSFYLLATRCILLMSDKYLNSSSCRILASNNV